eukprot:Filipodium_phascolosomae@DN4190_c0_g1_i1.p1
MHNFPEGMVTAVSAMRNWRFGVVMTLAVAFHNIPEGLAVAMPAYYATKSRMLALTFALVSGLAEPLGGLLAWAIIDSINNPLAFALIFGICAGMMVYVSVQSLMAQALKYDPDNKISGTTFFFGVIVMAASLVLLHASGTHSHGGGDGHEHEHIVLL